MTARADMSPLLPSFGGQDTLRIRLLLDRLGNTPPQVLLLEGGTETQRMDAAHYWAARCNCPQAPSTGSPCLQCPTCHQIAADEFRDWLAYDARISNKDDEDHQGVLRALNMDNVRLLKQRLRDVTHGSGRRVVVLLGMGSNTLRDEAANALLKALEEPTPSTVFVLLAPQRLQLLPTLVSRSFCITLPWPDSRVEDEAMREWEESLAHFLCHATGFLGKTAAKGAVDSALAHRLLGCCRKAMCRVLAGQHTEERALDSAFLHLDNERRLTACQWFAEAQAALRYSVTPARILEALAMRLCSLCRPLSRAVPTQRMSFPRHNRS